MFFVSFFFQKPFPCHSLSQGQRRLVFIFYNSRAAPLKNGIESSLPLKQSSSFLLEPSSRGSHKYKSRTKQGECRDIINYSIGDENNRVETKTKKKNDQTLWASQDGRGPSFSLTVRLATNISPQLGQLKWLHSQTLDTTERDVMWATKCECGTTEPKRGTFFSDSNTGLVRTRRIR